MKAQGLASRKLKKNKTGEITACLCVCGSDLVEGQSAHARGRVEELDRCS